MQLSVLFVVAVASLGLSSAATTPNPSDSHLEKRKCFKTGEKEKVTRCYGISSKKSVKYTVGLLGPNAGATRYLGEDECYDGLHKEVVNCNRGGETTYGNWYYRADPNAERC
ncbi:hypothetical protein ACCO45_012429 [Purpureocillium lilacinum]|uniref:Uncharacterized protein n=1 Tax=Purpureocillium lilacinum TaxID=33203 RepID=A0ACC4D7Z3_PURLI